MKVFLGYKQRGTMFIRKNSFQAIVFSSMLLSSAAFIACSDDSSASGTSENEVPVDSTNVNIPGGDPTIPTDPTQPGVPGESSSSGETTQTPEEPEQSIADTPISEDELKDDGAADVTSLAINVSGAAEIGPFADGAAVSVYSVDAKTMVSSTTKIDAKVSGNLGKFSVTGNLTSAIASVEVAGSYVNFAMDEQHFARLPLKSLTDMRNRKTVNVNVLTHIEYGRVQNLVSQQGLSFTAAKIRAEKEVQEAFGFKHDSTLFEDITLFSTGDAVRNLQAVSTVLLMDRNADEVDVLLSKISQDIAEDGTWDDEDSKALLGDAAFENDISDAYNKLIRLGGSDIENYQSSVDAIWASAYGLGKCDASNDRQLKPNANTKSGRYGSQFVCRDGAWSVATKAILTDYSATAQYGACTEANEGKMELQADGSYVICSRETWREATSSDIDNLKVAESNGACTADKAGSIVQVGSDYYICSSNIWLKTKNTPVDYSKGRAMNKRLGRGINFGNSWDSQGSDDCGWSNCIQDGWFKIAKDAGFNSIRLPVRWDNDASGSNVSSSRLAGVKADIELALAQGMVVIVNFHHHAIASKYSSSEKERFVAMWAQVAKEMDKYGDDKIVLEILNEPNGITVDQVNDLMTSAYKVIRQNAPGKTIMFEAGGYAKFAQIKNLTLPADGNIIVSGHYYEPYGFTHQGHGYNASASATFSTKTINNDFQDYADAISQTFPDINGGCVPINMGEFGVATTNGGSQVSESSRAQWTDAVIAAAEKHGFSWQYWGFAGVGGFEAYNKNSGQWYSEIYQVFQKYLSK